MNSNWEFLARILEWLERRLVVLILGAYFTAACLPGLGVLIKEAKLPLFLPGAPEAAASPSSLMLACMLFAAGLKAKPDRLRRAIGRPRLILVGLAANIAVPVIYSLLAAQAMGFWHNDKEAGLIVLGLALVAAMPVAGSSAAWAQNANGDLAISLGLVIASTLLSPISTPLALHAIGLGSQGSSAHELHKIAGQSAGAFLASWVLLPSILGMIVRAAAGEARVKRVEKPLKLCTTAILIMLVYANASACLPGALGTPDWDFLALTLIAVTGLCVVTFSAGYLLGKWLGTSRDEHASLIFGLGMNNNGTGLVLASTALSAHPMAMLPIIVYNLAQHLAAGAVHFAMNRDEAGSRADRA